MTLRAGLLGVGGIAARHAGAMEKVEGLTLVAACGREEENTAEFSERYGATPYTDYRRMLGEEALDLLVVAIPPFAHGGEVEEAAAAGINLLVEKPIALDMGRAEAMVAATANVTAACGFMYRFGGAVERWEALREAGEVGQVAHFAGSFHANALHAPWWRERDKSGGQMVEQLIHIVDLARLNLGRPSKIYAQATNFCHRNVPGYSSEDVSAMVLGYDDGRIGVLHASNVAIPGRWMKQWQVAGEKMTGLFADWNNAELVHTDGEMRSEMIAATTDPFVAQFADVADAIRNRRQPRVPLSDGAETLRIVLAARQSADEGREIRL